MKRLVNNANNPGGASALAGLAAAVCFSVIWLGGGLVALLSHGGMA